SKVVWAARRGCRTGQSREEIEEVTLRPGCSIRAARWQLEIPPVWANSRCVLDAAARAREGPCQQHDALVGVAWTARNSHETNPRLPGPRPWRSCSRLAWAVPREGMCWEQSPQKRTIATSRSETKTTEPE